MAKVTREEHLAWCKRRALDYLDFGDVQSAVASMILNLAEHPETRIDGKSALNALAITVAASGDVGEARRYIDGFR